MTIDGFIVHPQWNDKATFAHSEMPEHGYTTIMPFQLQFVVPPGFNGVTAELSAIDAATAKAAEAYHQAIGALRERKAALLQLSYEDGEVQDAPAADAPPQTFQDIDDDLCF